MAHELVRMPLREGREIWFDPSVQGRLDEMARFADSIGKRDEYERALTRLAFPTFFGQKTRTIVYNDFAPLSLGFSVQTQDKSGAWKFAMNGGFIYHQNEKEWSIHT